MTGAAGEVLSEVRGRMGMITLNRAKALNALSLGMVRDLLATLLAWQKDDQVLAVAIRGMGKALHPRVSSVVSTVQRTANIGLSNPMLPSIVEIAVVRWSI